MKKIDVNWNQWIIRFSFALLVIIGYKVISNYNAIFSSIQSFTHIISPFIIGFVIAALSDLTLIAIGALGVALALMYLTLDKGGSNSGSNNGGSSNTGDPLGDILDDY